MWLQSDDSWGWNHLKGFLTACLCGGDVVGWDSRMAWASPQDGDSILRVSISVEPSVFLV